MSDAILLSSPRLLTCDEARARDGDPLGAIDDAALLIDGERIAALGPAAELERAHPGVRRIVHAGLVSPGLVDAHTHAVWVGSRAGEYAMRMAGADYEAISAAGGGIVASTRAVRAASLDELAHVLEARLRRMAALGVTTVEVKSGYGLDEASERRQLQAVAQLSDRADLPTLVPTFLGLHAVGPEHGGNRDAYAAACMSWLESIAQDGLACFADAYVDRSAFSVEQARPLLRRARELGLGVRLHVGQFADVGGAELAAELGAASADHLEQVGDAGLAALAGAGVHAVLLPVASFTLGQAPPPIARLRAAGVRLVVASDANPGTAPSESLPLAMALALHSYGLSVAEVWLGATRLAACSLGSDAGVLKPGAPADVVLWDLPSEQDVLLPWGVARTSAVLRGGRLLAGSLP